LSARNFETNETIPGLSTTIEVREEADGRGQLFVLFNVGSDLRSVEEFVKIFDTLFGCWHKRISFPQTHKTGQRRSEAAARTGTYVVCLDCGREFAYDWERMRVVAEHDKGRFAQARVEMEAKAS
jgi:hypothetical protein